MRQNISTKIPGLVFTWPPTIGDAACPWWFVYPARLRRALYFSFEWLSVGDSFLVRDGRSCQLPTLSARTPFGLDLCRPPCMAPQSLSSYVPQSYWFRTPCVLGCPRPRSYTLSPSSSDGDIPFRTECYKVSDSLCNVWLWVSIFFLNYCQFKLVWWLSKTLIYKYVY